MKTTITGMNRQSDRQLLDRASTSQLRGWAMILITMHHVAQYLHQGFTDYSWMPSYSMLTQQLGYIGTGIFFFLSGYGMLCSLRHKSVTGTYAASKAYKLLVPYLICRLFTLAQICISGHSVNLWSYLVNVLTFHRSWFFQVIVALYVIVLLLFRVSKNEKRNVAVVALLCLAWLPAAYLGMGLAKWWYNSILCFPLGMLFALCMPIIRKHERLVCTVAAAVCLTCLCMKLYVFRAHSIGYEILAAMGVSVVSASLFSRLTLHSKAIAFIGDKSLYFYCLQGVVALVDCTHNFMFLSILTVAAIGLLTFVFAKIGDGGFNALFPTPSAKESRHSL